MTTYRILAATALTAALLVAAPRARAGELDEALRPRDIPHNVEFASLDVPVARPAASPAQPRQDAPARRDHPALKPERGFWSWLGDLFSF